MPNVVITGADRGFGLWLCREFLGRGWDVFAGKFIQDYDLLEQLQAENDRLHILPLNVGDEGSIRDAFERVSARVDSLDMLISNAALMGPVNCRLYEPPMDIEAVWTSFNVNALGPMRLVQYFLPLLDAGDRKRICFTSSEVSCISLMRHRAESAYPYPMSKSALNMGVRLLHNQLYPQGYSVRLFHPGWMKREEKDGSLSENGRFDPRKTAQFAAKYFDEDLRDEHRLVLYDFLGQEWPF